MSSVADIARPYARAAFEFASEAKTVEHFAHMLSILARVCSNPKIKNALTFPLTATEQFNLMTEICRDYLDQPALNFVHILAQNHRLLLLPEIYQQFIRLQEQAVNTVEVEVTSVYPLSTALTTKIKAALEKRFRATVQLNHHLDPAILGGAIIRVGDEVIDGSISGRLQRLATHLHLKENICL